MLLIGNRRYIGSKRSIVGAIFEVVEKYIGKDGYVFADLFAGTGTVADFFMSRKKRVIVNDTLYSNYVAYQAWFGNGRIDLDKLTSIINDFNSINPESLPGNYFSRIYGGKYFSVLDARKIGHIRETISEIFLTERERYILITALIYAADKIANTVGHFEHFLSSPPVFKDFQMQLPTISTDHTEAKIYMMDANALVKKIYCDVAYIDPPYNARQYINFYHVLENLARWEKPEDFEGTSMKFKRNHLKSDYSKSKAPLVMEDLINNTKAELIIVSYNNTYTAKSSASNNKISPEQLERILENRGKILEIREVGHKFFNSGKTDFKDHKELLYICRPT